ncbi:MAG: hypothetical protein GX974_05350, partial [Clostridiales bacterium]|nr:hypothetical protein [Clostridiales bacterium]
RVKAPDVSDYEEIFIAHLLDDGKVEYHDVTFEDGYLTWEAADFSYYALIGGVGEADRELDEELMEEEDTETTDEVNKETQSVSTSQTWIWTLIGFLAGTGIIAFIIAILIRNKNK